MPRGGARPNSGPPPDPNSARQQLLAKRLEGSATRGGARPGAGRPKGSCSGEKRATASRTEELSRANLRAFAVAGLRDLHGFPEQLPTSVYEELLAEWHLIGAVIRSCRVPSKAERRLCELRAWKLARYGTEDTPDSKDSPSYIAGLLRMQTGATDIPASAIEAKRVLLQLTRLLKEMKS